jgi:hypothetical protein
MTELKNEQKATNLSILWQGVLNLMGYSDDPGTLVGEVIQDPDNDKTSNTRLESIRSGSGSLHPMLPLRRFGFL